MCSGWGVRLKPSEHSLRDWRVEPYAALILDGPHTNRFEWPTYVWHIVLPHLAVELIQPVFGDFRLHFRWHCCSVFGFRRHAKTIQVEIVS